MAMGWVHPWVGLGSVRLGSVRFEQRNIKLVRWGSVLDYFLRCNSATVTILRGLRTGD